MRIFSRYMIRRFAGPFLFGLGVFALLIFLGNLFERMNKLLASQASGPVIAQYLLLYLPYWAIRVVPMATLLATLFAVSGFARSGEFVATQAAGFEPARLFRPLLAAALAIGLGAFLAQETLLPICYRRARFLWQEHIHPEWEWDKYQERVLAVDGGRMVSFDEFVVKEGRFDRPVLDYYGGRRLQRQIDALRGRWDAARGLWVFEDGVDRRFAPDGTVLAESRFTRLESDLTTPPKRLRPSEKDPDEMSALESVAYLRGLREAGRPTQRARTGLHAKLAYPFTNLILCALGIPIALRLRRASRAWAFAAALGVSFVYLTVIELGGLMGKAGRVPAPLAAWSANLLFAAAAAALYRRAEA